MVNLEYKPNLAFQNKTNRVIKYCFIKEKVFLLIAFKGITLFRFQKIDWVIFFILFYFQIEFVCSIISFINMQWNFLDLDLEFFCGKVLNSGFSFPSLNGSSDFLFLLVPVLSSST